MPENELREALAALVADQPETPSPAALVIARVRRSRRRQAVLGAAALAAAVIGGLLVGLPGRAPQPVQPPRLCQVQLPPGWSRALADPQTLHHDPTQIARAPDGSTRYVQRNGQILQLTGPGGERRVVLDLPATPPALKATGWSVSGTVTGDWFVFALQPTTDGKSNTAPWGQYAGLYAWNGRTGVLRALLEASADPRLEMSTWTVGDGLVAWDTTPFRAEPLSPFAATWYHTIEDLDTGHRIAVPRSTDFLAGDLALGVGEHGLVAVSAHTGAPRAIPDALSRAFHWHGEMQSSPGPDVVVWSTESTTYPMDVGNGRQVQATQQLWNVWWPGATGVLRFTPDPRRPNESVVPIGANYLIVSSGLPHMTPGSNRVSFTNERTALVDLRTLGYALAPEDVTDRALNLDALPRLPGC